MFLGFFHEFWMWFRLLFTLIYVLDCPLRDVCSNLCICVLTCVTGKTCPMNRIMLDIFSIQYDGAVLWPLAIWQWYFDGQLFSFPVQFKKADNYVGNPPASRENTRLKQILFLRMHNYMRAMDNCHVALVYTYIRLCSRTLTKPINYSVWCKA